MILTGLEIVKEWKAGRIEIEPFRADQINPNSYDFRLAKSLSVYSNHVLDPRKENPQEEILLPESGLVLQPGRIYLGRTQERMGSDYYVPIIHGKSSIARLGLFIHVTADLIDIGYHEQWTLQLNPIQPIRIYPDMRIGHATFSKVFGEIVLLPEWRPLPEI
jgi:dCTP deaminase